MTIGIIGLGRVGQGIGKNIATEGTEVIGYDISKEACSSAAESDIKIATNNREVAEKSSLIILSLPNAGAIRDSVETVVSNASPNTSIFDTSTVSPLLSKELAERAKKEKISYHDAPITGGAVGAHEGELTMLVGGNPERVKSNKEELSPAFESIYHVGEVGDAQFVKLIHNHVGQTVVIILLEGLLLADELNVDPSILYRSLRYYTDIYNDKLDSFFSNEYRAEFSEHFSLENKESYQNEFSLKLAHKDMMELNRLSDNFNTYLPLGSMVEQLHREGVNAGYGDELHYDLLQLYTERFDKEIETTESKRKKGIGEIL